MKKDELHRTSVRPAAVAGTFYPADAQSLSDQIQRFLQAVPPRPALPGTIKALIVPHAGYMYSGQVAAHAYSLLRGLVFDTVIVIAPSHRYPLRGAALYHRGAYQIPLGLIPVDHDLAERLMQENEHIRAIPEAHDREHALEVQLPFLKSVLGNFLLLPMLMGSCDYSMCESIAVSLAKAVQGKRVLIVASSDLSHYHSYTTAITLDQRVIDYIKAFNVRGLFNAISNQSCEACGAVPIITTMLCAQRLGASKSEVLYYANSGDVSGDKSTVVGYLSAALYAPSSTQKRAAGTDLGLSEEDKKILHTIARNAIESQCRGKSMPPIPSPLSDKLKEQRGVFVTLRRGNTLRGCIGYIKAQKPLYQAVQEMALAAAFQDTRFRPITEDELNDITIEISVLTPLQPISRIDEIEVGTHGLYIIKDLHSGLLLPQVAIEHQWDRETFLRNTCLKAGLPENAWQESDCEIYIFSADIF